MLPSSFIAFQNILVLSSALGDVSLKATATSSLSSASTPMTPSAPAHTANCAKRDKRMVVVVGMPVARGELMTGVLSVTVTEAALPCANREEEPWRPAGKTEDGSSHASKISSCSERRHVEFISLYSKLEVHVQCLQSPVGSRKVYMDPQDDVRFDNNEYSATFELHKYSSSSYLPLINLQQLLPLPTYLPLNASNTSLFVIVHQASSDNNGPDRTISLTFKRFYKTTANSSSHIVGGDTLHHKSQPIR